MSSPPPTAPAAPATPKERGCRPDPFSESKNYELFRRQIGIFFLANPEIYDTDMRKIFFALTLLNEGPPGQWAQNYIERVEAQADPAGNIPDAAWGTFNTFMNSLRDSFANPNKGRSASNTLETLTYDNNRQADEFFQEFETLAGRAGYINNNAYLIDLLERKIPKHLLKKVYNDTDLNAPIPRQTIHHRQPHLTPKLPLEFMEAQENPWTSVAIDQRPSSGRRSDEDKVFWMWKGGTHGVQLSAREAKEATTDTLKEPAAPSDSSLVPPPPRNRLSVTPPHATSSTQIFDTYDNCTYIATNEIDCLNRTKTALDQDDLEQLRGPPPLEEEPKEPGTREARRHTLTTKATVLARHVGLERTSINTDQGKGTPFAYTEDVDSSPLADETLKNSENRSPSHEEVIMLSDEERQSKDTDWIKKLEELHRRTETYRRGDTRAIMYRPSERCAGK
ncbi:hypothetical protein PILCRDRAFT_9967 [Piloderma croceum F 1598]|uniref:Retrotransposon gag domain-containing protein n=1 Tax=Piloderma croceum (strain F 1598) TaxID=765440 RepID=A0A0C3B0L4_PILCF|nr:hypothetical protein PILCRDRAFT_9967 [Piloderma croceum F 1598]